MKLFIIIFFLTIKIYALDITPYFSKTTGAYYQDGVDRVIIKDIDQAKDKIEMAMYYLTNKEITKSLIDAHKRGVKIKIFTDDKKVRSQRYRYLASEGIDIRNDKNPKAIMHNKFLVIDQRLVWISSANYTVYSFYRNYDNFIRINDKDFARYYRNKFDSLFYRYRFIHRPFRDSKLAVYFSPEHNFKQELLKQIRKAKSSIKFLAFAFTDRDIAYALINAKRRGVKIHGVYDKAQNDYQKYSTYKMLKSHQINVKLDKNRYKLHSKVFIIDKKTVITGSYNFTKSANSLNAENSVIIKDKKIAKAYLERFKEIYP